ncbi:unnamed protein product [Paramecium sonneborni]|uniref:Kinesin motor domain-containing protein n=1 Tax=Paramecium sonneborni TaxID=65129 RepID=A0A8S1QHS5_9CILI|nr:unnamed protein product [Paramecium sonneborni]
MSKSSVIDVFLRVRPTKNPSNLFKLNKDEGTAEFTIPKNPDQGYINNQIEKHTFNFAGVFPTDTTQEEIFDKIAKDVVDSAIEGYNGTIFAYGQTGSGKTYSMTGNPEARSSAGIIPRTLYHIYDYARRESELIIDVTISYLEIYGGSGYDLLVADNRSRNLHDLPKVQAMATANGQTILQGLSLKKAQTEEDALNLLFIGEQNRVIAETPKNDASTRSHCIFIVILECRKPTSDVKTVSKLCLVDLSGSERIGKTGVEGILQREATGINLSLHFLELVIDCLNRQANGENIHIPYRDSLMTLVLKDSLGGNCKTRMIATMSSEPDDLPESICTCRFAGRVANIKNKVTRNEAVDPFIIIEKLKRENQQLKAELAMIKGQSIKDHLESYEIDECKKKVDEFLNSEDPAAILVVNDHLKMNECFFQLKHMLKNLNKKGSLQPVVSQPQNLTTNNTVELQQLNDEVLRLKQLIIQRDNEIMILLNLIQKGKGSQANQSLVLQGPISEQPEVQQANTSSILQPIEFPKQVEIDRQSQILTEKPAIKKQNFMQGSLDSEPMSQTTKNTTTAQLKELGGMLSEPINISNEQLLDRNSALEMFRKSYRKAQAQEDLKQELYDKMMTSKELGLFINNQRNVISQLKDKIEQTRKEQVLLGLVSSDPNQVSTEEEKLIAEYNKQKDIYKQSFDKLKQLKAEVERMSTQLKHSREKMQQDFEKWIDMMLKQRNLSMAATSVLSDFKNLSQKGGEDVNSMVQQFYKNKEICNQLLQK